MASSRSLESIDKEKSKMINDVDVVSLSAVSFKVQSIDENEFSEFVKDAANELRFFWFIIELIKGRE